MIPNILELARTNLLISEHVKEKLLGDAPVLAAALDAGIQNGLSPAEKLAYQVRINILCMFVFKYSNFLSCFVFTKKKYNAFIKTLILSQLHPLALLEITPLFAQILFCLMMLAK